MFSPSRIWNAYFVKKTRMAYLVDKTRLQTVGPGASLTTKTSPESFAKKRLPKIAKKNVLVKNICCHDSNPYWVFGNFDRSEASHLTVILTPGAI